MLMMYILAVKNLAYDTFHAQKAIRLTALQIHEHRLQTCGAYNNSVLKQIIFHVKVLIMSPLTVIWIPQWKEVWANKGLNVSI